MFKKALVCGVAAVAVLLLNPRTGAGDRLRST
jgi:hypothetical protein